MSAAMERLSSADLKPCTRNGCVDELCACQPCPICYKRVPKWILHLKNQSLNSGAWIGPHCISCDVKLFEDGIHGDAVAPGVWKSALRKTIR